MYVADPANQGSRTGYRLAAAAAGLALSGAALTVIATPSPAAAIPIPICAPYGSEIFVTNESLLGGDVGLIRLDKATGARSALSDNTNPVGGPDFDTPGPLAFEADGNILVADSGSRGVPAVIRVAPSTGVRTLVSGNAAPAGGPTLHNVRSIAVEANGDIVIVDNDGVPPGGKVIRVNPVTGVRTTVSRNAAPAGGPTFHDPYDLAVAANGDILVLNNTLSGGEVFSVDPQTGARTLVSNNTNPVGGPAFSLPVGMTLDYDGNILVSDWNAFGGDPGIIRVNPTTGGRTTVSENTSPAGGTSFQNLGDLAFHCGAILVVNRDGHAVLSVNPLTGVRTTVSDNATPAGQPDFDFPWGIAVRPIWSVSPTTPGPGWPTVPIG